MGRFMKMQCHLSSLEFPQWAKKWINIRKIFSNFYDCKRCGIKKMLENLEYEFEGQPHSGIDDARNIARVALRLLHDGAIMRDNERLRNDINTATNQNEDTSNAEEKDDVSIINRFSSLYASSSGFYRPLT